MLKIEAYNYDINYNHDTIIIQAAAINVSVLCCGQQPKTQEFINAVLVLFDLVLDTLPIYSFARKVNSSL